MTQTTNDRLANFLLAGLLIFIASTLFDYFLRKTQLYQSWPQVLLLTLLMLPLIGPTLLAYTKRAILGVNPFTQPRWWCHLIPSLLLLGILSPYVLLPDRYQIDMNTQEIPALWLAIVPLLIYAHIFIYVFLSIKPISVYHHHIREKFSNTERLNLDWLAHLALSLCVGLVAMILGNIFVVTWQESIPAIADLFIAFVSIFHFYIVFKGFSGLKHSYISPLLQVEEAKYKHSSLRKDSAQFILEKLQQLMSDQKLYLESEISLASLSKILATNSHYLSQILNEELGKNFYNYINEQRIEHAKQLLRDKNQPIPIIDIAFESGYNNKVSFYNAFRKYVGIAPKLYRKHALDQAELSAVSSFPP